VRARLLRPAAAFCLFLVAAAACTPNPQSRPTAITDAFYAVLAHSEDEGPVAADLSVSTVLSLKDASQSRLARDLDRLYDPSSSDYGHFLTPAEFAARYGPSKGEVEPVMSYLGGRGLTSEWQPGDPWLLTRGPASAIQQVFGVTLHWYRALDGSRFFAAAGDPRIPAALSSEVTGAARITTYRPANLAVPVGGLTPTDVIAAYDMKPLRDQGIDGTGQTIVIWGLDGFRQENMDQFVQKYGLPPINVTDAPASRPHIKTAKGGGENEMDIEVSHLIAPGANLVIWNAANSQTVGDMVNDIGKAVQSYPGAIFSHSWGLCDKVFGSSGAQALEAVAEKAASLGETHVAGTGDMGGYDCMRNAQVWGQPPDPKLISSVIPASLPGFLAAGGTRLSLRQDSTWLDEVPWEHPDTFLGGGGSISAYFDLPSWQHGPGVANQFNSAHRRTIPDISADADDVSGISIFSQGSWQMGSGTSQSAPIWAGVITLIDEFLTKQNLKPLAFVNPALYDLAAGKPPFPPLHDITAGGNFVYPCTPGYDLATGLGTPDVWNLARDLVQYQKNGGKI
jgi:kumamolisin